jgi:IclR helix-turn-helix domain
VALIDLMVERPNQNFTLAEISRRLGVHKQTCHSMLRTLTDAGWLVCHPSEKTYRLGGSTPCWRTPIVRGRGVPSEGVRCAPSASA